MHIPCIFLLAQGLSSRESTAGDKNAIRFSPAKKMDEEAS
jgi:hypothetical protein